MRLPNSSAVENPTFSQASLFTEDWFILGGNECVVRIKIINWTRKRAGKKIEIDSDARHPHRQKKEKGGGCHNLVIATSEDSAICDY